MTFSHMEGLIDHHDIIMVVYCGIDARSFKGVQRWQRQQREWGTTLWVRNH